MRIFFTKSSYKDTGLQLCPYNKIDDNGHIVCVGGDACKACKYCTHYEIKHSLVPKDVSNNIDEWYTRCCGYGMEQFNYMHLGFIECKHEDFNKKSIKLLLYKFWFRIKNLF